MDRYYPAWMFLEATHQKVTSFEALAAAYAGAIAEVGGGEVVKYAASNLDIDPGGYMSGSLASLRDALHRVGQDHFARFVTSKELSWFIVNHDDDYEVTLEHPSESSTKPEFPEWVRVMREVGRRAVDFPAFASSAVTRRPSGFTGFVPSPPLSRTNHLVTASDAEVDAAYDDPSAFWRAWDNIETVGKVKVCTRAVDALEEHAWLGYTFESTMEMARRAKAGRTEYAMKPYWGDEFAAWWQFGDLNDEKAGMPAIAPLGYDEETRAFELTGFITKTPLAEGGSEPRHVLLRELYDLRKLAKQKKDVKGRPIDAVNVIWPEKWMAESEKRPLLDCGLQVFYLDNAKKRIRVT